MHASGKQSFLEDTRLFRIFQGCFTVQLSRFFAVVLISSNFYIISLLLKFVNNFFIYFSIFRLKLCVSCCLCQTASLYYHPLQHLSTVFFIFLQNPPFWNFFWIPDEGFQFIYPILTLYTFQFLHPLYLIVFIFHTISRH